MSMSSEWTLTVPFDGGWMQVSGKIPDMAAVSAEDAAFVDSIREQVLDRIQQIIVARKQAATAKPDPAVSALAAALSPAAAESAVTGDTK